MQALSQFLRFISAQYPEMSSCSQVSRFMLARSSGHAPSVKAIHRPHAPG